MASSTHPRILVVGSMNMDLVLRVERMPHPGESYFGNEYHTVPGGKGANQAVAAARLGARVTFAGRVGDDAYGKRLIAGLESNGIDPAGVVVDPAHPTGLAVILVEPGGENRIVVFAGANMEIRSEDIAEAFEDDYDAVLINFEIPDPVVEAVYRHTRERGVPLILDAGPPRSFDLRRLSGVEILSPNETETEALTGLGCNTDDEAKQAARELRSLADAELVVIKLGSRGALAFDGEEYYRREAIPVPVVDTTAAGDAFTAGFAVSRLSGHNVQRALDYGTAAGAVAVSRLGAQPSLPTAEEAENLLAEQGRG